jgi:hypothetical protein
MAEYAKLDEGHGDINRSSPGTDSRRRYPRLGKGSPANSHLSTPLNSSAALVGEVGGFDSTDPYYVFQRDLVTKLELVDEALAEFLRVVHQTVRNTIHRCRFDFPLTKTNSHPCHSGHGCQ